jgi:hypothetical protein
MLSERKSIYHGAGGYVTMAVHCEDKVHSDGLVSF